MEQYDYYYINHLIRKDESYIKLLFLFKMKLPKHIAFFLFVIFFQFLGLIILANNLFENIEENEYNTVSKILRKITCFELLKEITYKSYEQLCIIIFFSLVLIILAYFKMYKTIKEQQTLKPSIFFNVMFIITMIIILISQHIKEILSFIFFINFFKTQNNKYPLLTNQNLNSIILIFNVASLIVMNLFTYIFFKLMNEPIFNSVFPLQIRMNKSLVFIKFIITNLQSIHYANIILDKNSSDMFKIIILGVINLCIIYQYISRFNKFDFKNSSFFFIEFLLQYAFFSSIIELGIYLTNQDKSAGNILFSVCKTCVSLNFTMLNNFIKNRKFLNLCKNTIFKKYYTKKYTEDELESIFYFQNILSECIQKNDKNKYEVITSIVQNHIKICDSEICNCRIMEKNNSSYESLLEKIFHSLNFYIDKDVNIIFSDYMHYMKKSPLFAYSIINTYINRNNSKLSLFEKSTFHYLAWRTIENSIKQYSTKDYVFFEKINKNVFIAAHFNRKLDSLCEIFEFIINFKDKFDNSLKVDGDYIDSYIFSEIDSVVSFCQRYKKEYKEFKADIREFFKNEKCLDLELTNKLYSFFSLFNKKIPVSIKSLLLSEFDHDFTLIKKRHEGNKHFQIIFEINEIFKINYFSHKLANALGYVLTDLIGEDIHKIFPPELRENHKKVILKYLLIEKNFKIIKKTFAFTKFNSILPVDVRACAFPNFSKNVSLIANVEVLNEDEMKVFYFILSEDFNTISINKNLERFYLLNFDLLSKIKADIFGMFDILHDFVTDKLKTRLNQIKSLSEVKNFFSTFRNIFNLRLNVDEEFNMPNPIVDMNTNKKKADSTEPTSFNSRIGLKNTTNISANNDTASPLNKLSQINSVLNKNLKKSSSEKTTCVLKIEKEKSVLVSYLQNSISKAIDLDLNMQQTARLEKAIEKLNSFDFTHFALKVNLKNFIDTPFYLVRITEFKKNKQLKNRFSNGQEVKKFQFFKKFLKGIASNKNQKNVTPLEAQNQGVPKLFNKNLAEVDIDDLEEELNQDFIEEIYDMITESNNERRRLDDDFTNTVKEDKEEKVVFKISQETETKAIISIILLTILIILIRIYLLFYKFDSIDELKSLFAIDYWNNIQNSSINFLHSSVLTLVFHLAKISEFSINNAVDDLQNILIRRNRDHRDIYNNLYHEIIKFNDENLLNYLYEDRKFDKIMLNWEKIEYVSSFSVESNYFQNDINTFAEENDYTDLIRDIESYLIFKKYKFKIKEVQTSKNVKLIYYLNNNIPFSFLTTINNVREYIGIKYQYSFNQTIIVTIVIESVCFFVGFMLIGLIIYFLIIYDKSYFNTLLNLFLDSHNDNLLSYKTPEKVFNFRKKLSNFRNLINDIYEVKLTLADKKKEILKILKKAAPTVKRRNGFVSNKFQGSSVYNEANIKRNHRFSFIEKVRTAFGGPEKNEDNDWKDCIAVNKGEFNDKGDKVKKGNVDHSMISNAQITTSTRHYQIRLVKLTKIFVSLILISLVSFSLASMFTSIQHTNKLSHTRTITNSLILRFSEISRLYNYVRNELFNYSADKNISENEDYNKLLIEIDWIRNNYTQFLNSYSQTLPNTWQFGQIVDSQLDESKENKKYLCKNMQDLCRLNVKGIDSGLESVIHALKVIYRDFVLNKKKNLLEKIDIVEYFNTDMFKLINLEVEYIFEGINQEFINKIHTDFLSIFDEINFIIVVLSFGFQICNLIIGLYLIFGYLKMFRSYLSMIYYSCDKFNKAMFTEDKNANAQGK